MEYKGYIATIEYDDVEDLLYGHVVNTGPVSMVNFAASDVEGLKREFKNSIDEHLEFCKQRGIEPLKPFSGKFNLRLGSDLHRWVTLAAMEDGESLNAWIKQALEDQLAMKRVRSREE